MNGADALLQAAGPRWDRCLLRQSGHDRDGAGGRPRPGSADPAGAGAVRRRGDRCGRRLRPGCRTAGAHADPSRARVRQRDRQSAQRAGGRTRRSSTSSAITPHGTSGADAPLTSDIASLARPVSRWYRSATTSEGLAGDLYSALGAAMKGGVATLVVPQDCAWGDAEEPSKPPRLESPHAPSARRCGLGSSRDEGIARRCCSSEDEAFVRRAARCRSCRGERGHRVDRDVSRGARSWRRRAVVPSAALLP